MKLWRCGHAKTPENTHGGTERTHAQCRTCRRATQRAADKRYRNTFNGYSKHLVAERARRWGNGARAGDGYRYGQKLRQLAAAEGKIGPDGTREWIEFVTAYNREHYEAVKAQLAERAAAEDRPLADRQAARRVA